MPDVLTEKQRQFNAAMEKYEKKPAYLAVGHIVSFTNVTLQAILAFLAFQQTIGPLRQVLTFAAAYIIADFVNGLVHMYMDSNDAYESAAGPLIAAFHLHHRTPVYKQNPLLVVYYHETGAKVWLAFFLLIAVPAVWLGALSGIAAYGVLYFAVLSSVAEVSHYLCHVPQSKLARFLGNMRVLLPIRHHTLHHTQDNVNYTFLNGMTDPLLNVIARFMSKGYKKTTDTHYACYTGAGTANRV